MLRKVRWWVCVRAYVEYVLKIRNVFLIKLAVSHVYVGGLGKLWQFKLKRGVAALLKAREQNLRR